MSRNSVLASTLGIIETIKNPQVQEAWSRLKAMMKYSITFDHVSDLLPPTLLSQQSGSYTFEIKLSVGEADEIGRSCETLGANQTHYNSRVLIRCLKVQPDGEVKSDCFPPNCSARVNNVFHKRQGQEGPMDITSYLKVNPDATNVVNVDIPSPSGFYVVTVILVRALSSSAVVMRVSDTRLRSPDVTKGRIRRYHELTSSEVSVTSTMFSLVCPLSQKRFAVPAQGENCNHLGCFDLYTYLKLNARSGKWLCPICNTKVLPTQLIVDGYWKQVVDAFTRDGNSSCNVLVTDEGDTNRSPVPIKAEANDVVEV